ncbi:MAG: hypothetical protein U0414_06915 [Polyangiaceae bacterium]
MALAVFGGGSIVIAACSSPQTTDGMDDILVPLSAVSENPFGDGPPKHTSEATTGGGATGDMNDEQKDSIRGAIKTGVDSSKQCFASVPSAKTTGEGEVKVTFDGSTGHVSNVEVGAPFAGSELEACIKKAFDTQIVLKFDGAPLTVPTTIKIDKPKTDTPKPKK